MDRLAQHRQQQQQQQGGYGGGGGRYDQGGYDNGRDYGSGGGYGQQGGYDQGGYDQGNYSQPDRYGGGGGGGGNYGSGGDYNPRRPNPYAQQDDRAQSYEMTSQQPYGGAGGHSSAPAAGGDDLTAFYDEIASIQDEIKRYNQNVATISDLQQRSLNNFDENQSQNLQNQLEGLSNEQSQISSQLKRRIKELERTRGSGRDAQIKTQQTAFIKSKFVDAIQNYQQIEQQSRQRYKQRVERQYKIVNPQATQEEVRAVVNGDNNDQVFSQALMNSNRYGQSRDAYREVQARHADIKKIEKTLTELAQLFQDMSVAVEQQEETVNVIQNNAIAVHKDVEQGHVEMGKAVESARGARKKRWICFAIIVIIIIIVVIVLLIQFKPWQTGGGGGGNNNNNNSSTSSNSTPTPTSTP